MKIFVTVGTTPFDQLIEECDKIAEDLNIFQFTAQISSGSYIPKNMNFFNFSNSIGQYYDSADVVICHAGAGTVYKLLENQKRIIVVPNLKRREKHQLEICHFIEKNRFALVAYQTSEIKNKINESQEFMSNPYIKEGDDIIKSVIDIINSIF